MIYLIYYKIPKDKFSKIHGFSYLRNQHSMKFSSKYNFWFGLYGWTKKKSVMKEFKRTRNMKYFEIKKTSLDNDIVDDLNKKSMRDLEIKIFPMTTVIDMVQEIIEFPITREEYHLCSCDDIDEDAEFIDRLSSTLDTSMFTNPNKFNQAVLSALSFLGFVDFYCYFSDDEISDIPDVVDIHARTSETLAYNRSYGVGYIGTRVMPSMTFGMFEIYTLLFGELLGV